jgi:DMSO reductase family type II enzyme heme b subunit
MGSPEAPIHYLWWNATRKEPQSLLATGIGTSSPGPDVRPTANAAADGSSWRVVLARAMGTGADVAPLAPGTTTGVGFAVWRGSNDERAGIKSFSGDWTELELDA